MPKKMIVTRAFPYGTRHMVAGDELVPATPVQARFLERSGRARYETKEDREREAAARAAERKAEMDARKAADDARRAEERMVRETARDAAKAKDDGSELDDLRAEAEALGVLDMRFGPDRLREEIARARNG